MFTPFNLPKSAYFNRFVPKNKFYDKVGVTKTVKDEFKDVIQKITWLYKLSEKTIGLSKTEDVEEIQIFVVTLKSKSIPKKAVKAIDKSIPYKILYVFVYDDDYAYGILLKDKESKEKSYYTDWNVSHKFDWNGINLESIYKNLVSSFITVPKKDSLGFDELVEIDTQMKTLESEITTLKKRIKKEKQFNRKVEMNKELLKKTEKLDRLRSQ